MIANGQATPGGRSNTDDDGMAKRLPEADTAWMTMVMIVDEINEGYYPGYMLVFAVIPATHAKLKPTAAAALLRSS